MKNRNRIAAASFHADALVFCNLIAFVPFFYAATRFVACFQTCDTIYEIFLPFERVN